MEATLMVENNNLKEHNQFLVAQVKSLFAKEKESARMIKYLKAENRKMQEINGDLLEQLSQVTKNTLEYI